MKSLFGLMGGGAVVTLWKSIPAFVKVPAIFGAGMLAAIELNKDANESWFSGKIFGGQAAQGEAQIIDPAATRKAIEAGKPVTGAAATFAAQYAGLQAEAAQKAAAAAAALADPVATRRAIDAGQPATSAVASATAQYENLTADAKQKEAYADAASESEDEIIAKLKAGRRVTSTEQLRLIELQSARQDYLTKKAKAEQAQLTTKIMRPYAPSKKGRNTIDDQIAKEFADDFGFRR